MALSFDQAMAQFEPQLPLGIGLSGGADSTALLLASASKWPGQVVALHVHHGLQGAADDFEAHCQHLCQCLAVPLRVARVDARADHGQSPEDAARRSRYAALQQLAGTSVASIALAQHADDQVETLLLALSRGAGLPGLSAMPDKWTRDGLCYYRPLLQVHGQALRDYLLKLQVTWVEDPTNTDVQFTRNRIRATLLPALARCLPAFRDTFTRSAAHVAQAQTLLEELAAQDLLPLQASRGAQGVRLKGLQSLSPARQANVLRYWLNTCHQTQASAAQLAELQGQLAACTTRAHQIRLKVGAGYVRLQGADLHWYNERL
jgi:tRNA(Ile)-lysidine synthase